jgi:hypothetical protein
MSETTRTDARHFFRHYRVFDGFAAESPLPYGGVTIFCQFDEDNLTAYYGVAVCSPLDNYCKRIGRLIAQGRADARGGAYIRAMDQEDLETKLLHIAIYRCGEIFRPKRVAGPHHLRRVSCKQRDRQRAQNG